ncbi:hypothetical protein V1527DRAFT_478403 [Lipomyces starkeyi]
MLFNTNNLPQQYLWDKLVSTPSLRSQFMNADEVLARQTRTYLKKSTHFLEVLFVLMHVTYGSPARTTEVNTWKHVNSVHSPRNVYCHSRGLIFLGLHNKTTSLTGVERFISFTLYTYL